MKVSLTRECTASNEDIISMLMRDANISQAVGNNSPISIVERIDYQPQTAICSPVCVV